MPSLGLKGTETSDRVLRHYGFEGGHGEGSPPLSGKGGNGTSGGVTRRSCLQFGAPE